MTEQPARRRPRLSPASVRASPEFGWEELADVAPAILPILKAHHTELVHDLPFDPDWDRFFQLERAGVLKVWVARSGPTLIGYIAWIIAPQLMARTQTHAVAEMFWLAPEWRSGWTGYRMFKTALDDLKPSRARVHTNPAAPRVGVIFRRLGFTPSALSYERQYDGIERR